MKVLVGSRNNAKIEGAKRAFERFFSNVEIEGISVESNVSEQPVNIETYDGAKNRVDNLRKIDGTADYYVAVESGIINLYGEWQIVSIAYIENKTGIKSTGTSAGYPVPERYVKDIIDTNIGKVLTRIFETDSKRTSEGGISILTNGAVTRYDLTEQSIIMGLTKYINEGKWK